MRRSLSHASPIELAYSPPGRSQGGSYRRRQTFVQFNPPSAVVSVQSLGQGRKFRPGLLPWLAFSGAIRLREKWFQEVVVKPRHSFLILLLSPVGLF